MPKMTFIDPDGKRHEVEAPVGLSVLEIAHRNNINLEGACEGSLACSTCHVIVDQEDFERLKEPTEDEIRLAISGNLCRCTGYVNIVKAYQSAAAELRKGGA